MEAIWEWLGRNWDWIAFIAAGVGAWVCTPSVREKMRRRQRLLEKVEESEAHEEIRRLRHDVIELGNLLTIVILLLAWLLLYLVIIRY